MSAREALSDPNNVSANKSGGLWYRRWFAAMEKNRELYEALNNICEMQEQRYGDGMRTHMDLVGLCVVARLALANARGEA